MHSFGGNMKIKLKKKEKRIPPNSMWCFNYAGYDSSIIEKLNSGKSVVVEKIPKPASEFVKKINKKENN
jgi:MinD-like ATPase involved in chromosome partitioning or flagellar assembly